MEDYTTEVGALEGPTVPESKVSAPASADDQIFSMKKAVDYLQVSDSRIKAAIEQGVLPAQRSDTGGTKAAYQIKKSDLDRLVADGKVSRRKRRSAKTSLHGLNPDKLTIKQAAEVTGLSFSTLQTQASNGKLPSVKVQVGPNTFQRFVRLADVKALGIVPSARGRKRTVDVADALVKAGKVSLSPVAAKPEVNLDSELLRLADMVRSGSFHVTKLSVGLEFTGENS